MTVGPRTSEERVIANYAAAVAIAVAVFVAATALDARWRQVAQSEAMLFGATEAAFAFLVA